MGPSDAIPPPGPGSAPVNPAGTGFGKFGGSVTAWWAQMAQHQNVTTAKQQFHAAASHVKTRAKGLKLAMPVDVKIDFIRPAFDTLQETLVATWKQLPPPVQQGAPFVGVAVGSGLLVFLLQQRRVNRYRGQGEELTLQVKSLKKEREDLLKRVNLLKARAGTPRSDIEVRMASAVAEATNAAAAAADAAARAATACIIQRPPTASPPAAF